MKLEIRDYEDRYNVVSPEELSQQLDAFLLIPICAVLDGYDINPMLAQEIGYIERDILKVGSDDDEAVFIIELAFRQRLACVVLFTTPKHPAGRLFDFARPLVLYVAVPVFLACPGEPEVVLVQSNRAVQHRLELVKGAILPNDDIAPQFGWVALELHAKAVGRHR
jgi:hypothetical protein